MGIELELVYTHEHDLECGHTVRAIGGTSPGNDMSCPRCDEWITVTTVYRLGYCGTGNA